MFTDKMYQLLLLKTLEVRACYMREKIKTFILFLKLFRIMN